MEKFNEEIKEGIVLVDFYATWCGPCKMLMPVIDEIISSRFDIKVLKIDVDTNQEVVMNYKIMSVPTLKLFKDGVELSSRSGYATLDDLVSWIDKNI